GRSRSGPPGEIAAQQSRQFGQQLTVCAGIARQPRQHQPVQMGFGRDHGTIGFIRSMEPEVTGVPSFLKMEPAPDRKFRYPPTLSAAKDGRLKERSLTMRNTILAAAAVTFALTTGLTGAAFADATQQAPATKGHSIDYGESPSGVNIPTTQPSGGKVSDEMSAP